MTDRFALALWVQLVSMLTVCAAVAAPAATQPWPGVAAAVVVVAALDLLWDAWPALDPSAAFERAARAAQVAALTPGDTNWRSSADELPRSPDARPRDDMRRYLADHGLADPARRHLHPR
jgi:hypothetical protein